RALRTQIGIAGEQPAEAGRELLVQTRRAETLAEARGEAQARPYAVTDRPGARRRTTEHAVVVVARGQFPVERSQVSVPAGERGRVVAALIEHIRIRESVHVFAAFVHAFDACGQRLIR